MAWLIRHARRHQGQAMVEFSLVLPLLLVIILLIIMVSFIWAIRISAHKAAFDAAKHVAKTTQAGQNMDPSEAQRALDYDYNGSWVFKTFSDPPVLDPGYPSAGPDSDGTGFFKPEAVTVRIAYHPKNIPAWDILSRFYGSNTSSPEFIHESATAARVVNKY